MIQELGKTMEKMQETLAKNILQELQELQELKNYNYNYKN